MLLDEIKYEHLKRIYSDISNSAQHCWEIAAMIDIHCLMDSINKANYTVSNIISPAPIFISLFVNESQILILRWAVFTVVAVTHYAQLYGANNPLLDLIDRLKSYVESFVVLLKKVI